MASALRPTPETGRVAATKMPASAIGPSWTKRAGREARLAFRQAQRSGDREGAMRIAMQAEEAGLPAQASIGSAERRLAGQYQGRGADTAITAEVASALTPPAVDTAGRPRMTNDMRRGDPGFQEQPSQIISTDSSGQPTVDGRPIPVRGSANWKGASPVRTAGFRDAAMSAGNMGIDPRTGRRLVDESEVASPAPEQTPVPGATEPPENPVSGSRVPATGDAESRLGATPRRWSPALQGIAGRRALSDNLRKSIEAGGGDLSGDRLKRAKAEADRLGITDEQFLDELQDLGVSMPAADLDSIRPRDNRSLDRRLRDYQDEYLGGGPSSEMSARLRADANTNRMAAEGMRRAREQTATRERTPAPSPAPSAPAPPTLRQPAPVAPSRSSVVGGSPAPSPSPTSAPPSAAFRLGQTLQNYTPEAVARRMVVAGSQAGINTLQNARQMQLETSASAARTTIDAIRAATATARATDEYLTRTRGRLARGLRDLRRGFQTPQR